MKGVDIFMVVKVVNKGLEVRLYPKEDMVNVFNQNIGNVRFVWNHLLAEYTKTYSMFIQHGYTKLKCNMTTFNTMLNMLKKEYSFLGLSESSSLQQAYRDLINAFNKFFKEGSGYPRFKRKSNSKQSFRIQNNKNIKVQGNQIVLPKIGPVYFRTSRQYKQILNNPDTKINNVTIKRHNGKYYAVFNVETNIEVFEKTFDRIGIDLGLRTLATLSNGLEKANLDVSYEEKMIRKYQKRLSRKKHMSKRYQKTQKTYWKWIDKKTNKILDTYHKISHDLVQAYDLICMEDLNVKGMFKNKYWSPKLQRIALYSLVEKIRYKAQWHNKKFIQVDRWFASSKICHQCGHYNHDLKYEKEWTCPQCKRHHNRDINASKNILNEGIRILQQKTIKNLRDWGDSTVYLGALESTAREVRILELHSSR